MCHFNPTEISLKRVRVFTKKAALRTFTLKVEKDVWGAQPFTVSQFSPVSSPVREQVFSARGLVYAQISWLRNGCWTPEVAWEFHKAQMEPPQTNPSSSVYSRTQLHLLLRKIAPRFFIFLILF